MNKKILLILALSAASCLNVDANFKTTTGTAMFTIKDTTRHSHLGSFSEVGPTVTLKNGSGSITNPYGFKDTFEITTPDQTGYNASITSSGRFSGTQQENFFRKNPVGRIQEESVSNCAPGRDECTPSTDKKLSKYDYDSIGYDITSVPGTDEKSIDLYNNDNKINKDYIVSIEKEGNGDFEIDPISMVISNTPESPTQVATGGTT